MHTCRPQAQREREPSRTLGFFTISLKIQQRAEDFCGVENTSANLQCNGDQFFEVKEIREKRGWTGSCCKKQPLWKDGGEMSRRNPEV